ncbi:hypothetical protein [Marinifilum flexuosum]|uniref:hypothetical protein n=1 Tax=Marinifilum flexuosum TaxID=1117708 RepID=UPI0024952817|nr:hypothetical protein [Marinifilum flexuosum]
MMKKMTQQEQDALKEKLYQEYIEKQTQQELIKVHTKFLSSLKQYQKAIQENQLKVSNRIPTSIAVLDREINKHLEKINHD